MSENNPIVFKHSSLETATDVGNCLTWKMEAIRADNLPVDTGLADYIAFSVGNLEGQLAQLKELKKQASERENELKRQIEHIKEDGATFLLGNGIDRLDGLICSSVTVTKAKAEKTELIDKKELVINISQDELEELLIGLGKAEYKTVKEEKVTKAQPAKLKINHRKVHTTEVIEEKETK